MRLARSSRYLSLLIDTFATHIMPDLKSASVRGNAEYFFNTLKALLERELHCRETLPLINVDGANILAELNLALGEGVLLKHIESLTDVSLDPIDVFEKLNSDISLSAERLGLMGEDVPASLQSLLRRAAEWECGAHNNLLAHSGNETESTVVKSGASLSREAFQSYIQSVHPDGSKAEVTAYDRILGGFGNQTWVVTVRDAASHDNHWIVRKKEPVLVIEHNDYQLEREYGLLCAINATGFPAPKPLWMAKDVPGSDAPFYVMERLPGKPPGSFLGGANKLPESLVLEWADLLARLHSIPLESLGDLIHQFDSPEVLTETVEQNFRRKLLEWRAYVKATAHLPSPTLVYLFNWLERHIPKDNGKPVLTHGDFGIHNMLVNDNHVSAVLDWEGSAFGSPALDLSYVRPVVEQIMDWQHFLRHYEDCGGQSIAAETLNYCTSFQTMKMSVAINRAVKLTQDGILGEIRHTVFELGLNPHFMNLALSSTTLDKA